MDTGAIDAIFIILSSLGGVAAIIGAAGWAKAERIRAERTDQAASAANPTQESAVLTELKGLKQQMAQMHSTSHQFDISFDEALGRLEQRVSRVETKTALPPTGQTTPAEETQRAGRH